MKNQKVNQVRPGIYVQGIIYALTFIIFGKLLLMMQKDATSTILTFLSVSVWGMGNYFCRMNRKFFLSFCMEALLLAVVAGISFSFRVGYLTPFDTFICERFPAIAPGLTTKLILLLGVWIGVHLMNMMCDSINKTILGDVSFFKKVVDVTTKVVGPVIITVILFISGTVQNKTESKKVDALLTFAASVNTTPKGTNWNFSSLPQDKINEIKLFENRPLAEGKTKVSIQAVDPLKPGVNQVGYGITNAEISEAIMYGFLPKGSALPERLTKNEADAWFQDVTIPTYLAQVKEVVNPNVKLNGYQILGLYSFCHNLGKSNLKSLIASPGRLNDGNMEETKKNLVKYCNVITYKNGKRIVTPYKGLKIRRGWEKNLLDTEDFPSPLTLL
ncbi:MAG: hypothetical protein V4686_03805 [Patescibacteria group bacterium]